MPMTRLLLIAHAATAWNAERRYQGWTDVPLSDIGRDQVRRLTHALRREPIDAVFASDLSRSVETAVRLGEPRDLAVRVDRRLREMNFGRWEGRTALEVDYVSDAWIHGEIDARPPDGESLAELADRVASFLAELPVGDIAVVGHRGALRVLVCRLLGLPATSHWSFQLDVASISQMRLESGRAVLTHLNDTHHLEDREECHG
jgi:broad specificity phosphatase PhoE